MVLVNSLSSAQSAARLSRLLQKSKNKKSRYKVNTSLRVLKRGVGVSKYGKILRKYLIINLLHYLGQKFGCLIKMPYHVAGLGVGSFPH